MDPAAKIFLLPGELKVSWEPCVMSTLLGSCVSVVLFNTEFTYGGLNHYLLPTQSGQLQNGDEPSRYGDYATRKLVEQMTRFDPDIRHLEAKVFGGNSVVESITSGNIGEKNVAMARQVLHEFGIPVVNEFIMKDHGIKLEYHNYNNRVLVRKISSQELRTAPLADPETTAPAGAGRVLLVTADVRMRGFFRNWAGFRKRMQLIEADNLFAARAQLPRGSLDLMVIDNSCKFLDLEQLIGSARKRNPELGFILVASQHDDLPACFDQLQAVIVRESLTPENHVRVLTTQIQHDSSWLHG